MTSPNLPTVGQTENLDQVFLNEMICIITTVSLFYNAPNPMLLIILSSYQ